MGVFSFGDVYILLDDGVRGAYGVFSAVVMLIFFLRMVILLRADGVRGAYGVVSAVVVLIFFVRTVFVVFLMCLHGFLHIDRIYLSVIVVFSMF